LNHLYDDPNVIILSVTGPGLVEFKLINVYNEKRQGEEIGVGQYTIKRSLERMNIQRRVLICGDFNAYYQ
jgi:hypothetical protein